jgi:hypothetical protein
VEVEVARKALSRAFPTPSASQADGAEEGEEGATAPLFPPTDASAATPLPFPAATMAAASWDGVAGWAVVARMKVMWGGGMEEDRASIEMEEAPPPTPALAPAPAPAAVAELEVLAWLCCC